MSEVDVTSEIFGGMTAETDGLPPARRHMAMLTYCIGLAMSVLDGNIANTALPSIAVQLHAKPEVSIWVVNAFLLAVSICVVPMSSLADIIGYKRVYQAGLVLFTLASVGCSLPRSLEELVFARVFQGVGAACMWSVSAAVMRYTYPRALLGRAVGLSGMVVFSSAAAGPSIASGILAIATWHWLFAINIPFGLLALSLSEKTLAPANGTRHKWDLQSALLNAATVILLITGIDGIGESNYRRVAIAELIIAVFFGALLVRRQLSLRIPMLAVDLFERPIFALASVSSVCAFMAQGLAFVVLPFYFVDALGISQVKAGLLLTPWPIAAGVMSHFSGRLADRHSLRVLGTSGMLCMCSGMVLLALAPVHPSTFDIVWRAALGGAGFGFFGAPNSRAMVASAPRERSGGAGGIATMSRIVGQSIGVSVVAVVFGLVSHGEVTLRSVNVALICGASFALVSAAISTARVPHVQPE